MNQEQALKMQEWHAAVTDAMEAKKVLEKEMALRKEIMQLFFPDPKEGVNKVSLGDGWTLKTNYKLERKVDAALLPSVFHQLREIGVTPDTLIRVEPKLDVKVYRELLTDNGVAKKIFDQAITVKPGSPTMEIIPPKGEA